MSSSIKIDTQPCVDYVEDLSAYVDGELAQPGPQLARLVSHMGGCAGCHDYTNTLRQLSELNRTAATFPDSDNGGPESYGDPALDEDTAARVDPAGLFASIARNLVEEKRETLARLFYEIGKAYALAGNRALQEKRRHSVAHASQPLPIRGTEARARRELKDAEALERQVNRDGAHGRRSGTGLLLRRSRQLFGSPRRGSATLTRARRFLEESLALDESLDEARLYLGFRHAVVGRPDRARIQFRKVYLEGRTSLLRLLGAQALGRLHAESGDYRRAIECYEEVVGSSDANAKEAAELFPSFLNLAVNYAKAGDIDKSVDTFSDLARRFPERLPQIRDLLSRKTFFQALLNQNFTLKRTLASRAPTLFAA
jgi:tetratricopeptide (TPR) repeat protein